MAKLIGSICTVLLFAISVTVPVAYPEGKVYKYKDAKGNWCFTDDPSKVPGIDITKEEPAVVQVPMPKTSDGVEERVPKYTSPKTKIDSARDATVLVKTSLAEGSGFFVTTKGHILTNKHLIPYTPEHRDEIRIKENRLTEARKRLDSELEQIERMRTTLAQLEASYQRYTLLTGYTDPTVVTEHIEYRERLKRRMANYLSFETAYNSELRELNDIKERLLNGTIQVVLVGGHSLPASLIALAISSDLALLKVYGENTPCLELMEPEKLHHGQTLYAIGSPMGESFRHTVSAGVFSGMRDFGTESALTVKGKFIQTTASLNTGNSGGPLVDENGKAVGVNTWIIKKGIAEGMGFAIPITVALEEFRPILGKLR